MKNKEDKHYTGVVRLEDAFKTVVLSSKTEKAHVPRMSIQRQKYNEVLSWMEPYAEKVEVLENGKLNIKGKPVMPTLAEFKDRFGMTGGEFRRLAKKMV